MAVNKNFVVKNGLEVNTKLILADVTNQKVGIGSTAPKFELEVAGGIGATSIVVTGVSTLASQGGITGIANQSGLGVRVDAIRRSFDAYLIDRNRSATAYYEAESSFLNKLKELEDLRVDKDPGTLYSSS